MSEPTVHEIAPTPTEQIIDSDIHNDIMAVLGGEPDQPASSEDQDTAASSPDTPEESVASMLASGQLQMDKPAEEAPAEPEPEKEAEPEVAEEPVSEITPEHLMQQADKDKGLPDDLLPDSEVDSVISGKKAQVAFKKERAYNKKLREQVAELTSQAQKVAAAEQDLEQFSELKGKTEQYESRIKELENEIGQMDLSRSPEFKAQYDHRIQSSFNKMVSLLVEEELTQDEAYNVAKDIISANNLHSREEIISEAGPRIASTLAAHANTIQELQQTRAAALSEWQASAAALEASVAKERLAEMSGKIGDVVTATVGKVVELGNPYYKTTENEEWNAQVKTRVDALKGLLLEGDYEKLALYVAEGLVADDLRSRHLTLMKQAQGLENELKQVIKSGPSFTGPSAAQTAPSSTGNPNAPVLGNGPLEDEIANFLAD